MEREERSAHARAASLGTRFQQCRRGCRPAGWRAALRVACRPQLAGGGRQRCRGRWCRSHAPQWVAAGGGDEGHVSVRAARGHCRSGAEQGRRTSQDATGISDGRLRCSSAFIRRLTASFPPPEPSALPYSSLLPSSSCPGGECGVKPVSPCGPKARGGTTCSICSGRSDAAYHTYWREWSRNGMSRTAGCGGGRTWRR